MFTLIWAPPGLASNIFRVLVKMKSAAVLYPALLQTGFLSAGPDGIRQERPHLLVVLEALGIMQVYILAVRPVSPSHGLSPAQPISIPLLFSGCSLLCGYLAHITLLVLSIVR